MQARFTKWWQSGSRASIPTWLVLLIATLVVLQISRLPSNARPMCDASGECHEAPEHPSPRTSYSASSQELSRWDRFHQALAAKAKTFTPHNQQAIVFLGDSITESWLGTSLDQPSKRSEGVPEILEQWAETSGFAPLVLAISGDQSQHLLHRLQTGEMSPSIATLQNATFVMMIGTNNLGRGHLPGPTAEGIRAVANWTLAHSRGRLLLLALLPRGDGAKKLARLCPPRCNSDGAPFSSFMPAVDKVNSALQRSVAPALQAQYGHQRVTLVDCGSSFRAEGGLDSDEVLTELMPDRLHPNAFGHALLRDCIEEALVTWGPVIATSR